MTEPDQVSAPRPSETSYIRAFISAFDRRAVAGYLAGLAAGIAYLFLAHESYDSAQLALGTGTTPLHDFQAFFFPTGVATLRAEPVAEGFLYPPSAALFFATVAWLPYRYAGLLWAGILVTATIALGLAPRLLNRIPRSPTQWVWFTLIVFSYPALHNLKFGQLSVPLCLLVVCSVAAHERGRTRLAALLLALAISFKPHFAIFVAPALARRDWSWLRWFVAFAAITLVGAPTALFGFQGTYDRYSDLVDAITSRAIGVLNDPNSQSLVSLFGRCCGGSVAGDSAVRGGGITMLAWAAVLAIMVRWARRMDLAGAMMALFCATPFVVPTSWPHYFAYLPVCHALLWRDVASDDSGVRRRIQRILVAGSAVLVSMPFFDLVSDRISFVRFGVPFMANLLTLIAIGVDVMSRSRRALPTVGAPRPDDELRR